MRRCWPTLARSSIFQRSSVKPASAVPSFVPDSPVRVRFAPSPTGFLHLGGVRSVLFNYLLRLRHGGSLILRIEDTDQQRYVQGAQEDIIRRLEWASIHFDEGPHIGGNYGPYVQSERLSQYQTVANKLVEDGHAYRCFCSPERLATLRATATGASGVRTSAATYDGKCRHLTPEEIQHNLHVEKKPFTIRLALPPQGSISVADAIRGEVTFNFEACEDVVLMKSSGWPTYHLCSTWDDHAMQITHVLRGEEWLSSTPYHVYLHSLWETDIETETDIQTGFKKSGKRKAPIFAHLPLLVNEDGKKLSKRHLSGDSPWSLQQLVRADQISAPVLVRYLAELGWNPPLSSSSSSPNPNTNPNTNTNTNTDTTTPTMATSGIEWSMEVLSQTFALPEVHKSPAALSLSRLQHLQKCWWREHWRLLWSETETETESFLWKRMQQAFVHRPLSKDVAWRMCEIAEERCASLSEVIGTFEWWDVRPPRDDDDKDEAAGQDSRIVEQLQVKYDALKASDVHANDNVTAADWKRWIKIDKKSGVRQADWFQHLRWILTGTRNGLSVVDIVEVLGKDEVLSRMRSHVGRGEKGELP